MTLLSQRDARIYFHLKFSFERFLSKYTHGGALFKRRNFLQIWKKTIVFFPLIQLCRLFSPPASSSSTAKQRLLLLRSSIPALRQREQPSSNLIEICCVCGFLIYILFTKVNCPHFKGEGRCYSMGEEINTTKGVLLLSKQPSCASCVIFCYESAIF